MNSPGYQALQQGAALFDAAGRGKIRVSGDDRARLLHAMTTNHVEGLQPGHCLYAFFLNSQGRILADVNIWNMGESLLLDTEPSTAQLVFEHLDKFIIADDVALMNETSGTASLIVDGPNAAAVVEKAGLPVPEVNQVAEKNGISIARTKSVSICCSIDEKSAVMTKLREAGAVDASNDDLLVFHLEQQIPSFGVDFSDKHIAQETNLMHAIHFKKGCYLGQEIVERVRSRGLVNRLLTPLSIEGTQVPVTDTEILSESKPVGKITSAAFSPTAGKVLAFGYVRAEIVRNQSLAGSPQLMVGEAIAHILKNLEGYA